MGNVMDRFIKPLIALYGDLDTDDADMVFDVYCKQLRSFDDEVLEAGFSTVAGSYYPSKRNPWPSPAICVKACANSAAAAKAKWQAQPKAERGEWSPESQRAADRRICSTIGRKAAAEGWILGLWDHYRRTENYPSQGEIAKMQAAARACNEGLSEARMPALQKLAASIAARRLEKAALAIGENA